MKIEYKKFVGIYDDVYPEGYCQHLIAEFDRLQEDGAGANRRRSEGALKHKKDDYQILMSLKGHELKLFDGRYPVDIFFDGLQKCYEEYVAEFSGLSDGRIRATAMKMQKTGPGGGYHVWHSEQGNDIHANRVLVYMLYLNTLGPQDGGETEFLYQRERYHPTENQMILWPAAYTHMHRGNPVLADTNKYIATGWFYYD